MPLPAAAPALSDSMVDCLLQAQDDLDEGVAVIERDRLVHVNDAYCRLLARTRAELESANGIDLVAPEARAAVLERFLANRNSGALSDRYETTLLRGDGTRVHVEVAMRVMQGPEGARVVSLVRDVTTHHEARQAALDHAVTRSLVRRLLQNMGRREGPRMRDMGRALARDVHGDSIGGYLKAYRAMGLGDIAVVDAQPGRARFAGDDLLERAPDASAPTCQMALGFLETAMAQLHGTTGLGSELRCQSLGHEKCVFVVAVRH